MQNGEVLLRVEDLSVNYHSEDAAIHAVSHVNFDIHKKQVVAVVGESGCGKSTLALSLIGLLPAPPAEVTSGKVVFEDKDVFSLPAREVQRIRGTDIGMIFQEPLSSLNPVLKVSDQIGEAIAIKRSRQTKRRELKAYSYKPGRLPLESPYRKLVSTGRMGHLRRRMPQEIEEQMIRALKLVRIPDPERILDRYPFELSGGMRQRVMIAMALSEDPKLLIADEPTTALDVTTQAQVLRLMMELVNELNTSLLIITHDLGVAAQIAERVLVMYAGVIVEDAAVNDLFANPRHPYTKGLLTCLPKASKKVGKLGSIPGSVIDLRQDVKWCQFADRCPYVMKRCREESPKLEGDENRVACFLYS